MNVHIAEGNSKTKVPLPAVIPVPKGEYKLYAAAMIRNDADIVAPFLAQAEELFDKVLIVDVQSTDGTREAIVSLAAASPKFRVFTADRQEKYQSAMMNRLARVAFAEGADWVFFLDTDEFINIESRSALVEYLSAFPGDVMYLPWINLVPSQYGTFTNFNIAQSFYWSGRTSSFCKAAISCVFAARHPEFYIHEGNHSVSREKLSEPVGIHSSLTLLHVPVRSVDRLNYKMSGAWRLLLTKHNRLPGEGSHVEDIVKLLEADRFEKCELNQVAADYGNTSAPVRSINPERECWPKIRMPGFISNRMSINSPGLSLGETIARDNSTKWRKADFVRGAAISANIDGEKILIQPQPVTGGGRFFVKQFEKLPAINPSAANFFGSHEGIDALYASVKKIDMLTFSAWSELVPALFALFSLLRPRRYVELGTHHGMSFFAACQASEELGIKSQCIAVDNWVGDPHASFYDVSVFDTFAANIKNKYPEQFYIRANFDQALLCFDDASIDLLHIDGFHSYAAVKEDFETWLPKMSQIGVVIIHDINVHEREFGVWRFWNEIKDKYPSLSLFHCHGLGIIYAGKAPSGFKEALIFLERNRGFKDVVRAYLQSIGALSIRYREAIGSAERGRGDHDQLKGDHDQLKGDYDQLRSHQNADFGPLLLELWKRSAGQEEKRAFRKRHRILSALFPDAVIQYLSNRQLVTLIKASRLFDKEYYLRTYPEVKRKPVHHYVKRGVFQFRNPNAQFDTSTYLLKNPDVLTSGRNPFVHYLLRGREEGREC